MTTTTVIHLCKTELCAQASNCPYGYKCQFAHDIHELGERMVPSNYKRKECKNQNTPCEFGVRCSFLHKDDYAWPIPGALGCFWMRCGPEKQLYRVTLPPRVIADQKKLFNSGLFRIFQWTFSLVQHGQLFLQFE